MEKKRRATILLSGFSLTLFLRILTVTSLIVLPIFMHDSLGVSYYSLGLYVALLWIGNAAALSFFDNALEFRAFKTLHRNWTLFHSSCNRSHSWPLRSFSVNERREFLACFLDARTCSSPRVCERFDQPFSS